MRDITKDLLPIFHVLLDILRECDLIEVRRHQRDGLILRASTVFELVNELERSDEQDSHLHPDYQPKLDRTLK
jgi:hypothetical protein